LLFVVVPKYKFFRHPNRGKWKFLFCIKPLENIAAGVLFVHLRGGTNLARNVQYDFARHLLLKERMTVWAAEMQSRPGTRLVRVTEMPV